MSQSVNHSVNHSLTQSINESIINQSIVMSKSLLSKGRADHVPASTQAQANVSRNLLHSAWLQTHRPAAPSVHWDGDAPLQRDCELRELSFCTSPLLVAWCRLSFRVWRRLWRHVLAVLCEHRDAAHLQMRPPRFCSCLPKSKLKALCLHRGESHGVKESGAAKAPRPESGELRRMALSWLCREAECKPALSAQEASSFHPPG